MWRIIFLLYLKSVILQTAIMQGVFTINLVVFDSKKTHVDGLDKLAKGCFLIFVSLLLVIYRGVHQIN